jgi:hypothetical protein
MPYLPHQEGIQGKSIKVIIDGGSCHNLANEELRVKLHLTKKRHPHPYKVQWLSDSSTIKVEHTVEVSFKIGAYEDTLECDAIAMTVCHLLSERPWQYDRSVIHNGRTNHYSFKWKDKEYVLRPMTASQVIVNKSQASTTPLHAQGESSKGVTHHKVSERHKPNMSASMLSANKDIILLATRRDLRNVSESPSHVLHFVSL